MEGSPAGVSSGESTASEQIECRVNRIVSPVPHLRSTYDHLGNGHGQSHVHVSPPVHHHPLTSRYVNVLSSCMEGHGYDALHNNSVHQASLPPICESTLIQNFTRDNVHVLKQLDNHAGDNQRLTIGKSTLSLTQIECICEAMLQRKDIKRLDEFLKPISHRLHIGSEAIYRARIHVLFHRQSFTEMYKLMESYDYSPKYHTEMQELWYQAHYKEQENVRGRILGAVDKYRIRNKFILPRTIWDGEKMTYCFKDRAREALKECFDRCPYPTPSEKKALSEITGLTSIQVSNWFKNKRQRQRTPQPREGCELDLAGNFGLQNSNTGQLRDDGNEALCDMKPLVSFRSHKKIKMVKPFGSGTLGMNMLDMGLPIPLTRKDAGPTYNSLPNVSILSKNHTSSVSHSSGQNDSTGLSSTGTPNNGISVIQALNNSQFYQQSAHYETLLHHQPTNSYSPHHHHSNSPHILSYG